MNQNNRKDPLVSILIPAYRSRWLDLCISACLGQTYTNFELLIGDDSTDGSISSVVKKWDDPRIQLIDNPFETKGGAANIKNLIEASSGEYLKFAFDDDFLMPQSVEKLVSACEDNSAIMAFHLRSAIDENGLLLPKLPEITVPLGENATTPQVISKSFFFKELINKSINLIGEPSNCIYHRNLITLQSSGNEKFINRNTLFLGDLKYYMNAFLSDNPVVFVPQYLSNVRQHSGQATYGRARPAGFYEWDFLRREAFKRHLLNEQEFMYGLVIQHESYKKLAAEETSFPFTEYLQKIAKSSNPSNEFLMDLFEEMIQYSDDYLLS